MSIDLHPVFQLTPNTDIPTNQITSELNSLRTIINRKFYSDLTNQQKIFFHSFLWDTLHGLAQHSSPAVRLASSSVLGNILLLLGPFYFSDLMNSLLESIKKLNENEGSYIYLTSFVYLSRFLSVSILNQILMNNSLILNLFSKTSSEHLPNLVTQLDNFSNKFLISVVDLFIQGALQNPNNRHLPKAAAFLISKSIDNYASILSNPKLSLHLISSLFPDQLPKTLDSNVALSILERAIKAIKNDKTLPTDYEAACKIAYQIISGNFADSNLIINQITEKIVSKSPNLTALMMLPINEKIINKLFNIDQINPEAEIEKNKINPLMNYFSLNFKSDFTEQLVILINQNLTPLSDSYSFALKVLGSVSSLLPFNSLNDLLLKAFSINTSNWIHKLWTLELISKLNFRMLSQSTTEKAFEVIDISSTSKTDKLTQSAKEVTIKIFETCHIEVFKLFIDEYCRKIDIFDQINFELRISYLSYVFRNTQAQIQESWTIGFTRLATLLYESVNLFDCNYSATVMMNFFNIIESIANNLKEDIMIILLFVKKALDIIEPSFSEFCGEEIGLKRPQMFISNQPNNNSNSNLLSNLSSSQLTRVDTDLTSSPDTRHTDILQSALAAFSMIANIPWSALDLKSDGVHFLYNLAITILPLFPSCSNILICSLMELSILTKPEVDKFIQKSLRYSKVDDSIFKIARLIEICIERYEDFNLSDYKQFPEYKQSLKIILTLSHDLDYVNVASAQAVLEFDKCKIPDKIIAKIIKKSQLYLISGDNINGNSDDASIIDPSILYGTNDEDTQEETYTPFNQPLESPGFLLYVQTLSPFFYKHVKVPKELLQPALLRSFFNYSTVKVNTQEANFLLEYCLEKTNEQCVRSFILYLIRNKIQIDLNPYLDHPLLQKKKNMSAVAGYIKIKKLPNDYITSVLKTDDLIGFVLNASTKLSRLLSITLIKIDPKYFMQKFMKIEKFHYAQIYNVCYYAKENIEFPPEDFYQFSVMLLSKYIESRKKKNIVRRLLTIFVFKNLKNNSVVQEACALLSCDIGPPSNIEYVKKLSNAQIIELYFESIVINRVISCRSILETLLIVLTKSTPYGMNLFTSLKPPTFEDIYSLMSTSFPMLQLPSIQTLPYRYYTELIKSTSKREMEASQAQPTINSNSNSILNPQISSLLIHQNQQNSNSEQNQNSNPTNLIDLSFSALPSQQIFKLLLSNPNDLNKSNFSFTFSRNYAFGIYVFHFVNTILSIIHRKISSMMSNQSPINPNNEIIANATKLVKDAFSFISTNYEFSNDSAYLVLFLQFYNTFLSTKIDSDQPDLDLINNNVSKLFENHLSIIPPLTVDVVIKISNHNKDLTYATTIFSCYLKEKESYESYYVAERAAVFTLASNEKYIKKDKKRLLKMESKNKRLDKDSNSLGKSSSSVDFIPSSSSADRVNLLATKRTTSARVDVDEPLDPTTFIIFGKSFLSTFCAFVVTKNQSKKEISYQNLLGLFTKRHEKAILTYVDRTSRPFSILFALMGDEKDKPPKILSSYINSFHDLLLVNQSEKKYNVF